MASYSVKYVTSFSPSLRDKTTLSMRCLVHLQGPWPFISARDLEQGRGRPPDVQTVVSVMHNLSKASFSKSLDTHPVRMS